MSEDKDGTVAAEVPRRVCAKCGFVVESATEEAEHARGDSRGCVRLLGAMVVDLHARLEKLKAAFGPVAHVAHHHGQSPEMSTRQTPSGLILP